MNELEIIRTDSIDGKRDSGQRGSALVIALFVLALISVFVALAMSRTAAEASAVGNETAEARTMYAAQGSLEMMTRNFNKVFETKLNPSTTDLAAVRNGVVPGLQPQFTFLQELDRTSNNTTVNLPGGPYAGLVAIRDNWRLRTTAYDTGGTQVRLTRNILNNRVPIFQFGIFYDDDLELFPGPWFGFGGRVHSNGHFFIAPSAAGVYFNSRVTAKGHVITQALRNGDTSRALNDQTFIKNASGVYRQLLPTQGSVLNGTPNVFALQPDMPVSRINSSFASQSSIFDGNLQAGVPELKLPLKVGRGADLREMIKRGREIANAGGGDLWRNNTGVLAPVTAADGVDDGILRSERFANKTGIRVSLADDKAKLPGCANGAGTASVTTPCGVRLDGHSSGNGTIPTAFPSPLPSPIPAVAPNPITDAVRGYQPKAMTDGYRATRVNGERLFSGNQVWIKVESVRTDDATGAIVTRDITEDILALGMTEEAPASFAIVGNNPSTFSSSLTATTPQAASSRTDSRSVIKIQRYVMPGPNFSTGLNVLTAYGAGTSAATVVRRWSGATLAGIAAGCTAGCATVRNTTPDTIAPNTPTQNMENYAHMKLATVNGVANEAIVPFPIQMFDTREGEHYDARSATYYPDQTKLTRNGIMSMIDIDVANLRRFFRGDFNGLFPTDTTFAVANANVGLTGADIPQREGWILYVSDRRGDADFDGELDMEDIYGAGFGNDGIMQPGEDLQKIGAFGFGVLNTSGYTTETERYRDRIIAPDLAAVNDHKYYRRGVRLVNGSTIPGVYDAATPANTRGFTVASENGVYVLGNYNATGAAAPPVSGNTPYDQYLPQNTPTHIPASIVADAITILSNSWQDANSFVSPYNQAGRIASNTTIRFAIISGDTISSKLNTPNQGGDERLNGGVHNFKRFLENWGGFRLDYSGSLINLFNSHNNNGSFKCCATVYNPPNRNWVFDSTFLDPARMPPGTPFFQYVQTTGFERSTD